MSQILEENIKRMSYTKPEMDCKIQPQRVARTEEGEKPEVFRLIRKRSIGNPVCESVFDVSKVDKKLKMY